MSKRKGALFLPLDVMFPDDPLVNAVGEQAAWLYVLMMLKAKALLSDGVLTEPQVEKLAVKGWKQRLERLLTTTDDSKVLVADITPAGAAVRRYWITGWDKHNDRAETVIERREKDAARKRQDRDSGRSPIGQVPPVRTESGRRVEKSREKNSRDPARINWDVSLADHTLAQCGTPQLCHFHRADTA